MRALSGWLRLCRCGAPSSAIVKEKLHLFYQNWKGYVTAGRGGSVRRVSRPKGNVTTIAIMATDQELWERAFLKHQNQDGLLDECCLVKALDECHKLNQSEILIEETGGRKITRDEFLSILQKPSTLESWAKTLSLDRLLAYSIHVSMNLSSDDVLASLKDVDSEVIDAVIQKYAELVKLDLLRTLGRGDNDQILAEISPQANFNIIQGGTVHEFHSSLTERLGWPSLDFYNEMEREHRVAHCFNRKDGLEVVLGTIESGDKEAIYPSDEFDFATGQKALPDRERMSKRKIPSLEILKSKHTGLRNEEVIGIVLYTGPMFRAYNNELRSVAVLGAQAMSDSSVHTSAQYPTTIFVICSAIVQLSRKQNICSGTVLYRGLGGTVAFPSTFYDSDEFGRKGIVEPGFMSTTEKFETAIQYSGLKRGKPHPLILEMRVRSVDRGADIREFSQYEHEAEFHWAPGCFLELVGQREKIVEFDEEQVRRRRTLKILEVRVNCNLKTMTIDELLMMRKSIHLQSFSLLINDVRRSFEDKELIDDVRARLARDATLNFDKEGNYTGEPIGTAEKLINMILGQCHDVWRKHGGIDYNQYKDVSKYRELVQEKMETAVMAKSKLSGWIEDATRKICLDFHSPLRVCHRERVSSLLRSLPLPTEPGRREHAEKLCVLMGLVVSAAQETNDLGEPRLVEAAAAGRTERDLQLLLAAGAEVEDADSEESTALFLAARNGHADIVRFLLESKAKADAMNVRGETAMWIAARNGQGQCVQLLIDRGVDVTTRDKGGVSPALMAADYGRRDILTTLIKAKADPNAADDSGCTPLFMAAYAGEDGCVEALLGLRADAGLTNATGHTPLMMAAQQGHAKCVELLLPAVSPAHVNLADRDDGDTALFLAAHGGYVECVALLHANGADPRLRSSSGATAEQVARDKGHDDCAELLRRLAEGAEEHPRPQDSDGGRELRRPRLSTGEGAQASPQGYGGP
jgi:ankyrin repeat protein